MGQPVEIRSDPAVHRAGLLDIDFEIEIDRIVQEALGNAVRHARASRIWVDLENLPGGLVVRIADDGLGFDPGTVERAGLGLAGMKERAMMLRASLIVRSQPGRGTVVELTVPWTKVDSSHVGSSAVAPKPAM